MAVVGNVWHSALEGIEHTSLSKHHCPVLLTDNGSQYPHNGMGGELEFSLGVRLVSAWCYSPPSFCQLKLPMVTDRKAKSAPCPFPEAV